MGATILFSEDGCYATDPVHVLQRLYESAQPELILNREPVTPAEKAYMLLFESFRPVVRLDAAAVTAAEPSSYPLERIAPPAASGLLPPVTGEYIQGLCEKTILTRKHYEDIRVHIETGDSRDKLHFIEDGFPAEFLAATRSIFVYPVRDNIEPVFKEKWPALKLVVIHSGDDTVPAGVVAAFLERHPGARIWQVNMAERPGPRAKPLPLLEQNRYWRGGSSKEDDPPVSCSRERDEFRNGTIFCTWRWETNPMRRDLFYKVADMAFREPVPTPITLYRYLDKEDYAELLPKAVAVLAPPGNGYDTHRCWEALYKGSWPIIFNIQHTRTLLDEYPSLPCLVIEGADDLRRLAVPPCPSPFHPLLLREYWRLQYEGVLLAATSQTSTGVAEL
jgi:hypothetical protein